MVTKGKIMPVKYMIFDMDGTLLDSLSVWADSDREFITGLGLKYEAECSLAMKKMHFNSACQYLVKEYSLPFSAEETGKRILAIVEEHYINGVPLKDGAEELLAAAYKAGIKMCVATSNKKSLAEAALKTKGIMKYFEFVLTSDEVGCGKESPEIFLKAAEMLGADCGSTAVFEDSIHAVQSAKAAGFKVVGVYDPLCPEEFDEIEKTADRTIKSFRELLRTCPQQSAAEFAGKTCAIPMWTGSNGVRQMKKILVGMSGGVDSSAAALALKEQGYKVGGCTLRLCGNDCTDAAAVCERLGIPHYIIDLEEQFRAEVTDRFAERYIRGETPNPCIFCNRYIKFGKMLEHALELGFDGIATGHYAKTVQDEKTGRTLLLRSADRKKDQTYVLYSMTQFQLGHTIFPLWDRSKEQNRSLAERYGLVNARKPDSQDICFVPDGDYAAFIEEYTKRSFPEGDFIDTKGNVIGRHGGIIRYTIGQRKGLGVTFGKPVYVCGKDAEKNTVTLGDSEDLLTTEAIAEDVNLISVPDITEPMKITAKTRYNMTDAAGTLERMGDSRIKVTFDVPQRAVTKGQALVVYNGDIVVGGGTII